MLEEILSRRSRLSESPAACRRAGIAPGARGTRHVRDAEASPVPTPRPRQRSRLPLHSADSCPDSLTAHHTRIRDTAPCGGTRSHSRRQGVPVTRREKCALFFLSARGERMPFTIEEFRDFIRMLDERPEWRSELRRLVLTDELLALPAQMAELRVHTEQRFQELAAAQRRTEERVTELAVAQRRTEERVTE